MDGNDYLAYEFVQNLGSLLFTAEPLRARGFEQQTSANSISPRWIIP